MNQDSVNKAVVLLMTLGITALFLAMIQQFLMALFLAGLFTALARPLYLTLLRRIGGRRHLASLLTLLIVVVVGLIPLVLLISVLVAQALDVSQALSGWIRTALAEPGALGAYLAQLPFYEELLVYQDEVIAQGSKVAAAISRILVDWVSGITLGTANFIFMSFVVLYSMYFLQIDGPRLIERILYYLPLKTSDERVMLEKFTSVTRATLKGTLLIGMLQGGLAGIAFAVAGIDNAVFWGTVMAVLSVIPNVGAALVWIPAVAILVTQGEVVTGVMLGLFCGLIVGSLDNVLRPVLVGKDTKMHELMIFFGTLGGILMFGLSGLFIGPLIASLFISIWEMYGVEFAEVLPDVDWVMDALHEEETAMEKPEEGESEIAQETASDEDQARSLG